MRQLLAAVREREQYFNSNRIFEVERTRNRTRMFMLALSAACGYWHRGLSPEVMLLLSVAEDFFLDLSEYDTLNLSSLLAFVIVLPQLPPVLFYFFALVITYCLLYWHYGWSIGDMTWRVGYTL